VLLELNPNVTHNGRTPDLIHPAQPDGSGDTIRVLDQPEDEAIRVQQSKHAKSIICAASMTHASDDLTPYMTPSSLTGSRFQNSEDFYIKLVAPPMLPWEVSEVILSSRRLKIPSSVTAQHSQRDVTYTSFEHGTNCAYNPRNFV
jgi:hypothetical protein